MDTRFEPRLVTCPWCGDTVLEESLPGKPGRVRCWTPYIDARGKALPSDVLHAHDPAAVSAYGNRLRDQDALEARAALQRPRAAPPPPAEPAPLPAPTLIAEYGDETI
jgi:hypothetical protein